MLSRRKAAPPEGGGAVRRGRPEDGEPKGRLPEDDASEDDAGPAAMIAAGPGQALSGGSAAVVGRPVGLAAAGERVGEHLVLLGGGGVAELRRVAAVGR